MFHPHRVDIITRRQTNRGPSGRKQTTAIEWIGGIAAIPAYVTGEGEPYRPEALFWMAADGAILGSTTARPGELLAMASEGLMCTIEFHLHDLRLLRQADVPLECRVGSKSCSFLKIGLLRLPQTS